MKAHKLRPRLPRFYHHTRYAPASAPPSSPSTRPPSPEEPSSFFFLFPSTTFLREFFFGVAVVWFLVLWRVFSPPWPLCLLAWKFGFFFWTLGLIPPPLSEVLFLPARNSFPVLRRSFFYFDSRRAARLPQRAMGRESLHAYGFLMSTE